MADLTKDQLLEQNTQLKKDLEDIKQALRDANTAAKETQTKLEGELTDERTRSGDLAGELNEAQELIEDLQKRLETAATLQAASDTVIVSDGTDHYKVLAPKFSHKRVEYTAEDLRTNQELVQQLVAAKVGFLVKIETEE